jgi:hypothetical protein
MVGSPPAQKFRGGNISHERLYKGRFRGTLDNPISWRMVTPVQAQCGLKSRAWTTTQVRSTMPSALATLS